MSLWGKLFRSSADVEPRVEPESPEGQQGNAEQTASQFRQREAEI